MNYIDFFNLDAGGVYTFHQLRLHNPQKSLLVKGVQSDNLLLKRIISTRNSILTVLDLPSHANQNSFLQFLKLGNTVHYFDHHFAGEMPENPLFHPHIDTSPDVCSNILVDRFLSGKFRLWDMLNLLETTFTYPHMSWPAV